MAKNNMKLKYKAPKRERNNKKETETDNQIKSFFFTLGGVLIGVGVAYLLMLGMKALGVFEKGYTKPAAEEIEISDELISIGTVFNRSEKNYYVLFDNYENEFSSDPYINTLLEKSETRVYKVDMNSPENAKYKSEEENTKAEKASDLKINGITLIKISNGKLVKYVSGSEAIEEYLSK